MRQVVRQANAGSGRTRVRSVSDQAMAVPSRRGCGPPRVSVSRHDRQRHKKHGGIGLLNRSGRTDAASSTAQAGRTLNPASSIGHENPWRRLPEERDLIRASSGWKAPDRRQPLTIRRIGAPGFEPGTSPTRTVRATRLRHAPSAVHCGTGRGIGAVSAVRASFVASICGERNTVDHVVIVTRR